MSFLIVIVFEDARTDHHPLGARFHALTYCAHVDAPIDLQNRAFTGKLANRL